MTNKEGISVEGLVERLRAKEHRGQFRMGGATITADGKATSWGGEKIMEWRNPDGPAAADLILALSEREAARDAEIAELKEALGNIIYLDHHNMGPESKATGIARAALTQGKD